MALSVTPTDEMKTLTVGEKIYEVVDDQAREDISEVKADLNKKANIDGYYQDMSVGTSDQLNSTQYVEDSVPYLFRTTGGSADVGGRADVRAIVGGSLVWNQLISISADRTKTQNNVTFTDNRDGSFNVSTTSEGASADTYIAYMLGNDSVKTGHKYVFKSTPSGGSLSTYYSYLIATGVISASNDKGDGAICVGLSDGIVNVVVMVKSGTVITTPIVFKPQLFDLTTMFGSTIADYIYSLEQANAGAGVAWFRKLFPKDYYTFNAGSMLHVEGVSAHVTTGFNQWDEVTEVGGINHSTGENISVSTVIRSKNYIPCLPSTAYYFANLSNAGSPYMHYYDADKRFLSYAEVTRNTVFTTPSNAHYIRFNMDTGYGTTYKNDICINFHWDGERDGEYEPYIKHSYPLDSSLTLRGIPKLDSANNLYYDGDTYESDGTVTRRYNYLEYDGSSDENWFLQSINSSGIANFYTSVPNYANNSIGIASSISNRFDRQTTAIANTTTEGYMFAGGGTLYIRIASTKADTSAAFRTWLASNPTAFVYMLATPTTETAEPYQNSQIVDDFGTEEYVTTSIVPVGHVTKYQPNLRAKLEMAPDSPDGDGDYIVRQANGENSYVSLTSTATIQDILARLAALEGGTT